MTEENIKDILDKFPAEEREFIKRGLEKWLNLDVFSTFKRGGYITNDTIKDLISTVLLDTWRESRKYFKLLNN